LNEPPPCCLCPPIFSFLMERVATPSRWPVTVFVECGIVVRAPRFEPPAMFAPFPPAGLGVSSRTELQIDAVTGTVQCGFVFLTQLRDIGFFHLSVPQVVGFFILNALPALLSQSTWAIPPCYPCLHFSSRIFFLSAAPLPPPWTRPNAHFCRLRDPPVRTLLAPFPLFGRGRSFFFPCRCPAEGWFLNLRRFLETQLLRALFSD